MSFIKERIFMLNNKAIMKKCNNGLKALLLKTAITDMSLYDRVDNDMVSNRQQKAIEVCRCVLNPLCMETQLFVINQVLFNYFLKS